MDADTPQSVGLTRDQILANKTLRRERVTVPEWGGDVYVREMTGDERDRFDASIVTKKGKGSNVTVEANLTSLRAKLLVLTCCDATGAPLFTDGDVGALGGLAAGALERLANVARRLSGLSEEAGEEALGNSAGGTGDASPSGSPSTSAT